MTFSALLAVPVLALSASAADAQPTGTPPSISPASASVSSLQVGDALTEVPASWSGMPVTSIQWYDCDRSGNNCQAISGASGHPGSPRIVVQSDVGSTIEVAETAVDSTGTTTLFSAPTIVVALPVNISPPRISGTVQQGQILTETNGMWTNNPTSFQYQWLRCDGAASNCGPISGATGQTYTVSSADIGSRIVVQETAVASGGTGVAVSSPTTTVVDPSSTSLLTVPANPVTNQGVTLVATVASTFAPAASSGTVSFDDAGVAIAGCSGIPVSTINPVVQATCQTTFSAATSPELLTAGFAPNAGAPVAASTSQSLTVPIGKATTSTSLSVANATVVVGSKTTYTARIATATAMATPAQPSGSVMFSDHGRPITSCSSQPLKSRHGSLSATCTIRYPRTGRHTITARYGGDVGFNGSTSSSRTVRAKATPVQIAGSITAVTDWRDYFTPTYTQFLTMVVHQLAPGTTILVTCVGQRCPIANQSFGVTKAACGSRTHCIAENGQITDLSPVLSGRRLRVGTVLTVELTRPNWIGKAYVFTMLSGHKPADQIECLAPGSTRPGVGC